MSIRKVILINIIHGNHFDTKVQRVNHLKNHSDHFMTQFMITKFFIITNIEKQNVF